MTFEELRREVDAILATAGGSGGSWWGDPEGAHGSEDSLIDRIARLYAPPEVVAELDRLAEAGFPRWCA